MRKLYNDLYLINLWIYLCWYLNNYNIIYILIYTRLMLIKWVHKALEIINLCEYYLSKMVFSNFFFLIFKEEDK
jgi:hypothetical protein